MALAGKGKTTVRRGEGRCECWCNTKKVDLLVEDEGESLLAIKLKACMNRRRKEDLGGSGRGTFLCDGPRLYHSDFKEREYNRLVCVENR